MAAPRPGLAAHGLEFTNVSGSIAAAIQFNRSSLLLNANRLKIRRESLFCLAIPIPDSFIPGGLPSGDAENRYQTATHHP